MRALTPTQLAGLIALADRASRFQLRVAKTTKYALERRGLVESTSLGWRLTGAGQALLDAIREQS